MYTRKPVVKLTGAEQFTNTNEKQFTVLDFWRYGFSSLNDNVLRGALAEFLVENALKSIDDISVRSAWGDYDVDYKGKRVEVKSCSYLQDWNQEKLSVIKWSGFKAKELYYSEAVKKLADVKKETDYKADVYVLCLLNHKDTDTLDILNMDQWCFFVLSKEELSRITNSGSSVSLSRLNACNVESVPFSKLADAIQLES